MADLQKPDVYIEEVDPAPQSEGVSPSQMGVVGRTYRGPVDTPVKVRSLDQFKKLFGPQIQESLVGNCMEQFFTNDGRIAVMVRVVPPGSLAADVDIDSPVKWTFRAKTPGIWGNELVVEIRGNVNFLNESGTPSYTKFDILVKEPDTFGTLLASETFEAVQFTDSTAADYAPTLVNDPLNGSALVVLDELLGGTPDFFDAVDVADELLAVADGLASRVQAVVDNTNTVIRNTVTITDGVQVVTDDGFGNLIGDVDPSGNNRFNYESGAADFNFAAVPAASTAITISYTHLPTSKDYALTGGTDGSNVITRSEVSHPDLAASERGIYAFNKLRDIVNIALPDFAGNSTVAQDLIDYAEARRDRFVVIAPPIGATVDEALIWLKNSVNRNSRKASCYYPALRWKNTQTNAVETVPALGAALGIFARTDRNKNVSKAPCGKIDGAIVGAEGPEFVLSETDERRLFQNRINPIVSTAAQGFAIWGARTLLFGATGLKANFVHIGPVRTYMFLQEFAYIRLQEFVFENNGRGLHTRVRGALNGDFNDFFKAGLFAGNLKSDAFFIICGGDNNEEEDIDNGMVNVDIGVALNKPAEFVVVRFQQKTAVRI